MIAWIVRKMRLPPRPVGGSYAPKNVCPPAPAESQSYSTSRMRDYRGSKNLIAPLDFLRARKGIRSTDLRPPPGGYSGYSGYSGYWGYMGYSGYLYPPQVVVLGIAHSLLVTLVIE